MFVKPAPGLVVRDPKTLVPLPPEGREVFGHDEYWWRRLRDGDVVAAVAAAASEPSA